MWIFGFSLGVCSTELRNLVSYLEYLVSNGRQVLLRGIRLGGSVTLCLATFWSLLSAAGGLMHFYCRNFERAVALPAGCSLDLQLSSSLNAAEGDAVRCHINILAVSLFIFEVHCDHSAEEWMIFRSQCRASSQIYIAMIQKSFSLYLSHLKVLYCAWFYVVITFARLT